jgi:hypothetical protein
MSDRRSQLPGLVPYGRGADVSTRNAINPGIESEAATSEPPKSLKSARSTKNVGIGKTGKNRIQSPIARQNNGIFEQTRWLPRALLVAYLRTVVLYRIIGRCCRTFLQKLGNGRV